MFNTSGFGNNTGRGQKRNCRTNSKVQHDYRRVANSKITGVLLGLAAEIEREFISSRTTEALAKRRAAGLPLGRPKRAVSAEKKLDKRKNESKRESKPL
jgi:DNA invertase Pin-like site-specific DNA recombinase